MGVILAIASRFSGRKGDRAVAAAFLLPTVLMLAVGLVYPGVRTIYQSFFDAAGSSFVGLDNYKTIFTNAGRAHRRCATRCSGCVITPFVATAIGLLYAILVDKARFEAAAKALIFLPMAISFVGASIIWKFVYEYRPAQGTIKQIGLLNQILVWLGGTPAAVAARTTLEHPVPHRHHDLDPGRLRDDVLSAAIKAIPDDIVEAARLDGVGRFGDVPLHHACRASGPRWSWC